MFKRVDRFEYDRLESLTAIIGIRVVQTYINSSIDELTRAFCDDPEFSTLSNYHWNKISCFDTVSNMARIAAAGRAFRYKLKINYPMVRQNWALEVDDIVKILKHVATFHVLKVRPEFE